MYVPDTAKTEFLTQTKGFVWCQPEHHVFILSGSDRECYQVWDDGMDRQSLHTVQIKVAAPGTDCYEGDGGED